MKKTPLFTLLLFLIIALASCEKNSTIAEKASSSSFDVGDAKVSSLIFNDVSYLGESPGTDLLSDFFKSSEWKAIPKGIKNQLTNAKEIIVDSSDIRVLKFQIGTPTTENQSDLVAWYYNGKFLVFISSLTLLSTGNYFFNRTNIIGSESYLNFQINRNNKVGYFNQVPVTEMPRFQSISFREPPEPTCMEKTDTWGDCMQCAYSECMDDWVCGLACNLNGGLLCAVAWGIGCAVYNDEV